MKINLLTHKVNNGYKNTINQKKETLNQFSRINFNYLNNLKVISNYSKTLINFQGRGKISKIHDELIKYIDEHPDALIKDIAEHFNVGITPLSDYIKRHDTIHYVLKKPISCLDEKAIRKYVEENPNKKYADIAKHFGVSYSYLYRFMMKKDIPYLAKKD